MCFQNYGLRKTPFQETIPEDTCKRDQTLLKCDPQHNCHIYWSLWRQFSQTKCFLVIWKVLRMFINISTTNEKYSLLNRANLREPIQVQLWKKGKTFPHFFSCIFQLQLTFWTSWKREDPDSWCISEITDSEKRC